MSEQIHTVDLIRHAHSAMNALQSDPETVPFIGGRQNHIPLSELGEEQSTRLGLVLQAEGFKPTIVLASPAVRTLRTCELSTLVLQGASIEPIIAPDFQELDQGDWTNQPRTLYTDPVVKEHMERLGWKFAAPRGESMEGVADRVLWRLGELARTALDRTEEPQRVLVYAHGVAIKASIGKLLGWSHEQTYKAKVDNISRTRLVRQNGRWQLDQITFNEQLVPGTTA